MVKLLAQFDGSARHNAKDWRDVDQTFLFKKVQVGKDQEKAQSEKDSHSKKQGGKNQTNNQVLIP